ncbi:MAG: redoxin domain-containing protein [Planctomycetes bacterium]|nr:redoxin domain-containing protein [Planctomycetota bacterium]
MTRVLFRTLAVTVFTSLPCLLIGQEAKPEAKQEGAPAAADTMKRPGHSFHGEVFNEGPRQAAYLMSEMPKIDFRITCKDPQAQAFFNQGVGQLHGFWNFESERSFRQVAAIDPDCAMAYWGMAMANFDNENRGKGFIAEAHKRREKADEREKMYIDGLHAYFEAGSSKNKERHEKFTRSLEKILYKYPQDIEAKALLTLRLWRDRDVGIPISSYLSIDALLSEIFAVDPMHPAHHYRIHLWDNEKTERALASAALSGQSSPGVAHMWHMGGHIFAGLKRYDDAAWQQEASARVDHAHMIRDRILPDQIHNFAHNNEWLIRDLVHIGRVRAAMDMAKNMCELPRHPRYNSISNGSSHYGRMRLFEVLNTFELWDQLVELCDTPYLEPTDNENEQLKRLRFLGIALFRTGKAEKAQTVMAEVRQRLNAKREAMDKAGLEAENKAKTENKPQPEIDKAKEDARKGQEGPVKDLEKVVAELEGHEAVYRTDYAGALTQFKIAETSKNGYLAWIYLMAGEKQEAENQARNFVNGNVNEIQPLARQVEVLWALDKKQEATEAFQKLRAISAEIDDLSVPTFARLLPIARELQWPDDWRMPAQPKSDIGNRPNLDSLGPFRWTPQPAQSWTLPDAQGQAHSLAEYRGRNLILIYYLGSGCLHCAEQLQAFGPMAKEFAELNISLVAISSDDLDGLRKSIENYKDGPMPIQLLANPDLSAFKAYRCHDDFEKLPLHGTFLIDSDGLVRWQDIGFDPFNDPKFLLGEARRLLRQVPTPNAGNAGKIAAGAANQGGS